MAAAWIRALGRWLLLLVQALLRQRTAWPAHLKLHMEQVVLRKLEKLQRDYNRFHLFRNFEQDGDRRPSHCKVCDRKQSWNIALLWRAWLCKRRLVWCWIRRRYWQERWRSQRKKVRSSSLEQQTSSNLSVSSDISFALLTTVSSYQKQKLLCRRWLASHACLASTHKNLSHRTSLWEAWHRPTRQSSDWTPHKR